MSPKFFFSCPQNVSFHVAQRFRKCIQARKQIYEQLQCLLYVNRLGWWLLPWDFDQYYEEIGNISNQQIWWFWNGFRFTSHSHFGICPLSLAHQENPSISEMMSHLFPPLDRQLQFERRVNKLPLTYIYLSCQDRPLETLTHHPGNWQLPINGFAKRVPSNLASSNKLNCFIAPVCGMCGGILFLLPLGAG